ncbi:hypothetical protein SAMN05892877_1189 [Rhizobium subbaraonis]|uniref:Antifreeze protein n=1 Tax=Rhizobium subbaraonis TaxID=908946 RepID=A0A285UVC8_9HYPH|nr:hypothetical protein [Rhizobium subbaraonis]SOC45782.1 hypothetical protein SAMN05892877_1189 [Rhizobium subbaraonis]
MSDFLKNSIAAVALTLAGLTSLAPAAHAASFDARIETVGYRDGYYGRAPERHHRWGDRRGRGRCAPWLAVEKARGYGVRGPRIADVSHRRVVVEGWRHHRYTQIAFANVARCPTLGR